MSGPEDFDLRNLIEQVLFSVRCEQLPDRC